MGIQIPIIFKQNQKIETTAKKKCKSDISSSTKISYSRKHSK